ncbi:hypothetical protein GGR56DRAFT_161588 [Xylariaceae sp. FL0804]|nr:hypothetical protein GGR56DRAFT_161588 [Xylariaceae sp. FL0804]
MMAEILGIVSGALTMTEGLLATFKVLNELWRTPAEVRNLEDQVQILSHVLRRVHNGAALLPANVIRRPLLRVGSVVQELEGIVRDKLSNRHGVALRASWSGSRFKIERLRRDLKDASGTLMLALVTELLPATERSESSLTAVLQHVVTSNDLAIETLVKVDRIAAAMPFSGYRPDSRNETGPRQAEPVQVRSRLPGETRDNNPPEHKKPAYSPTDVTRFCELNHAMHDALAARQSPKTILETSTSYRPSDYTALYGFPTIFSYEYQLVRSNEWERLNVCSLFFCSGSTNWVRVRAAIITTLDSKYWELEGGLHASFGRENLPAKLLSQLRKFLQQNSNLGQHATLSVYVGAHGLESDGDRASAIRIRLTEPRFDVRAYLRQKLRDTQTWTCRRYVERELSRKPMIGGTHHFFAWMKTRWVNEHRFGSTQTQIDKLFYHLSTLHRLKGSPGFHNFLGIVVNDSDDTLSGFFTEVPAKGHINFLLRRALETGIPIPFSRRLRWCRQIVEAVSALHDQGFVSGSLGNLMRSGITVDAQDRVVLMNDHSCVFYDGRTSEKGMSATNHNAAHEGLDSVTPATDVYDMGLSLWQLAKPQLTLSELISWLPEPGEVTSTRIVPGFNDPQDCEQSLPTAPSSRDTLPEGQQRNPEAAELQSGSSPNQNGILFGFNGPQYLKSAIEACIEPDPSSRLLAREILDMFPIEDELQFNVHLDARSESDVAPDASIHIKTADGNLNPQFEELNELYGYWLYCDLCGLQITDRYYHCNICTGGNVDICPTCLGKGCHCLNTGHYLRELYVISRDESVYFSSCDGNGKRQRIVI